MKALGVESPGLKTIFFTFSDTLVWTHPSSPPHHDWHHLWISEGCWTEAERPTTIHDDSCTREPLSSPGWDCFLLWNISYFIESSLFVIYYYNITNSTTFGSFTLAPINNIIIINDHTIIVSLVFYSVIHAKFLFWRTWLEGSIFASNGIYNV